jgi:hypothetical protein
MATGEFCSINVNQNRNKLMQELDRFDGMVIVSTKLFQNYAHVLRCRIQRSIHARIDNASLHREFFAMSFPTRSGRSLMTLSSRLYLVASLAGVF